jgi:hypothetical protein
MVLSLLMLNMQALIYSSWRRLPMAKTACRSTEYMLPTTVHHHCSAIDYARKKMWGNVKRG